MITLDDSSMCSVTLTTIIFEQLCVISIENRADVLSMLRRVDHFLNIPVSFHIITNIFSFISTKKSREHYMKIMETNYNQL